MKLKPELEVRRGGSVRSPFAFKSEALYNLSMFWITIQRALYTRSLVGATCQVALAIANVNRVLIATNGFFIVDV